MRFLTRSLIGTVLFCFTLGLLVLAAGTIFRAMSSDEDSPRGGRAPEERVFAVAVDTLERVTATPVVRAYGAVESWRTLELRATVGGRIVELSQIFRAGATVGAGDVLMRLDPAAAQTALDLAETEVAEAEAELREAEEAEVLAEAELAAALSQRDLQARALTRQRDLQTRGAATAAMVEAAELTLSAAEQALVSRRTSAAQARARIERARISVDRRRISLAEAERDLEDTVIRAPFAGRIGEVLVVPGGLVTANEQLGTLIDPDALEIAFRVSNTEFSRLSRVGDLRGREVSATLSIADLPITTTGRVDRVGAEVGEGQTGRLLYARLDQEGSRALRPGDFMTVRIGEPPLDNVAVVPARAVTTSGQILLLGEEDRLEATNVAILRRQGDLVIIGDAPYGRDYVVERLPQLGAGVKVRPIRPGEGDAVAQAAADETLTLDAARRARLIAFVEANTRMNADDKERILTQLSAEQVPRAMVERLERRMGG